MIVSEHRNIFQFPPLCPKTRSGDKRGKFVQWRPPFNAGKCHARDLGWFGLEGALKASLFHPLPWQIHLPLGQAGVAHLEALVVLGACREEMGFKFKKQ